MRRPGVGPDNRPMVLQTLLEPVPSLDFAVGTVVELAVCSRPTFHKESETSLYM